MSYRNFAIAVIAATPDGPTGPTVVVAAGHGARFPVPPFDATVWPPGALPDPTNAELVQVTAVNGDALTVTRGIEGTLVRSIVLGDVIANTVTAAALNAGFANASASVFAYKADANSQVLGDPGSGKVRWNAMPQTGATVLMLDTVTAGGFDVRNLVTQLAVDEKFLIQKADAADNVQTWKLRAAVVNYGSWFELPVSLVSSGGAGAFAHNADVAVIFTGRVA